MTDLVSLKRRADDYGIRVGIVYGRRLAILGPQHHARRDKAAVLREFHAEK